MKGIGDCGGMMFLRRFRSAHAHTQPMFCPSRPKWALEKSFWGTVVSSWPELENSSVS